MNDVKEKSRSETALKLMEFLLREDDVLISRSRIRKLVGASVATGVTMKELMSLLMPLMTEVIDECVIVE